MEMNPVIGKESCNGYTMIPLTSTELEDRIITISGMINEETLTTFRMQFRYLLKQSHDPITVVISSNGGEVTAGMAIYDMICNSSVQVSTICVGNAYSMGAVIFAAGHKGHRHMLPHSKVMIHEPLTPGGCGGSMSQVAVLAEDLLGTALLLAAILANICGRPVDELLEDMKYDHYFTAEESIEYGLCDSIITQLP